MQRHQQGSQPGTPGGGFGGHSAHGGSGFLGAQRPLYRYLSEPPRPEELASAGLLDAGGSASGGGGGPGSGSSGFLSPGALCCPTDTGELGPVVLFSCIA